MIRAAASSRRALARVLWLAALCQGFLVATPSAVAHEIEPAVLSLREVEAGRFTVSFRRAVSATGSELENAPVFPPHCTRRGSELDCRPLGLVGELGVSELDPSVHQVLVQIEWLGGMRTLRVLAAGSPTISVRGTPASASFAERFALAKDYTALGIWHILTGIDHLCFVIALSLLVGKGRPLLLAISAFTLAHSLTLAASVLRLVQAPAAPVEASIALSIVLVCAECLRPDATLTRRAPWLIALAFGLLHGFGFAGGLQELGIPPHQAPLALLSFNLGVELAQILTLLLIGVAAFALRTRPVQRRKLEHVVVYAMGSAACYWSLARIVEIFRN